jgi:hypothetical protein
MLRTLDATAERPPNGGGAECRVRRDLPGDPDQPPAQ